jgi:hydrogenase-4 membrane subunit HyfE
MYLQDERLAQLSVAVLLMYVVIFSNSMGTIVGCNIKHALRNNFLLQHLVAFLILLFFIVITTKETNQGGLLANFGFSVLVYVWFSMMTRMPIQVFLLVLMMLLLAYAIGQKNVKQSDRERKNTTKQQALITILAFSLTLIAFVVYSIEKKIKYGKQFSLVKFLTNPPKCQQCKLRCV